MDWRTWTHSKLYSGYTWCRDSILSNVTRPWTRIDDDDRENYNRRIGYKLGLCLYSVVSFATPVFAEGNTNNPGNTVIANPQATSSGQAVNQAIQVTGSNNFQQTYGAGIQCQTSTLAISPFSIQGWSNPGQYVTNDVGVAATVSFPLDGGAVELCKDAARTQIARNQAEADKASLDYNLVRVLKCQEIISKGAFLHPSSPYADLCRDVIALGEDGLFRNGVWQVVRSSPVDISTRQDS